MEYKPLIINCRSHSGGVYIIYLNTHRPEHANQHSKSTWRKTNSENSHILKYHKYY
jgi:hypothetical protein